MLTKKIFGIVLAGGEGKRLMPLTADRAKPAVPFAGQYRLIDFALSNLLNSGLRQIVVLTQYKSHSLDRHISQTWRLPGMLDSYVASVPAQQRLGKRWFSGSADAILQSLNLLRDEKPDIVVVVGADHVYRMDFNQMIEAVTRDGERSDSSHDMGGDIIPDFVSRNDAAVYDLKDNVLPGSTERDRYYWRDVGTIDSFFDAHQDLISTLPVFNLYNREWPIFSQQLNSPPAKIVRDARGELGTVIDSIISLGSVISGAHIERSVLGPWSVVESGARVMVPPHIDVGTRIVINTEDYGYYGRAQD